MKTYQQYLCALLQNPEFAQSIGHLQENFFASEEESAIKIAKRIRLLDEALKKEFEGSQSNINWTEEQKKMQQEKD